MHVAGQYDFAWRFRIESNDPTSVSCDVRVSACAKGWRAQLTCRTSWSCCSCRSIRELQPATAAAVTALSSSLAPVCLITALTDALSPSSTSVKALPALPARIHHSKSVLGLANEEGTPVRMLVLMA